MRVIRVYEKRLDNIDENVKYFKSLNKAKRYFKELVASHKKELVKEDDKLFKSYIECDVEYQVLTCKGKGRHKRQRLEIINNNIYQDFNDVLSVYLEEIKIE